MDRESVYIGGGLLLALVVATLLKEKVENVIDAKKEGLEKLAVAAAPVAKESGIPISILVTQAAHESNYGRSGLALKSNNLFGIKANSSWSGPFDTWPTSEVINGQLVKVQAKFRKYDSWEHSMRDFVSFIKGPRYARAYAAALARDAQTFFSELQKAGYATDPNYGAKLAGVYQSIEALV